jgi:UDPglucose 6-dehydrogenase
LHTELKVSKNKIQYATSAISSLKNADCYILLTGWDESKKLKPEDFTKHIKQPILIDGRKIYNPKESSQKMKFAAKGLGH